MSGVLDARHSDTLRLDHTTLKAESVGNDNTSYRISLAGPVGEHWAQTYRTIQADSTAYRRFRLDVPGGSVSFSCRTIEGPAEVMEVLERLETLLATVNRDAAAGPPAPAKGPS